MRGNGALRDRSDIGVVRRRVVGVVVVGVQVLAKLANLPQNLFAASTVQAHRVARILLFVGDVRDERVDLRELRAQEVRERRDDARNL